MFLKFATVNKDAEKEGKVRKYDDARRKFKFNCYLFVIYFAGTAHERRRPDAVPVRAAGRGDAAGGVREDHQGLRADPGIQHFLAGRWDKRIPE